jgi:DNA-binding IclR family transcriptional regulator
VLFAEDGLTSPSPNVLTFVMGQLPRARADFLKALQEQRSDHTARLQPFLSEMRELHGEMHSMIMAQQDLADAIREAVDVRRMPRPSRAGASPPLPSTAPGPRTPAES